MKKLILLFSLFIFLSATKAEAALNVFACEPEWAALAKEIGAENVTIFSATRGTQDPHHISAKPSLLAGIRKADLIICTGGGLEAGWLPVLMQNAPSQIQAGRPGNLMATEHLNLLGKPTVIDRSMGDVHPEGNPHIQTDPRNLLIVSKRLADQLSQIDPANKSAYQARALSFDTRWKSLIQKWANDASSLKGKTVITYHDNWAYLLSWLGIIQVDTLEVKPGIPPTASHLEQVLQSTKSANVKMILLAPFDNDQAAEWLAEKTSAKIIRLPFTVGGTEGVDTLPNLFDRTIALLKAAS